MGGTLWADLSDDIAAADAANKYLSKENMVSILHNYYEIPKYLVSLNAAFKEAGAVSH